jgi:hypothetical protein
MKSKAAKFNFYNEITDYTKRLGRLCPDIYDCVPELGDTIEVGIEFMGISIETGIVVRKIAESKQMIAIRKKLSDYYGLDDDDNEYIDKIFDFSASSDFNSDTSGFIVKFSVKVPTSFVKKNSTPTSDLKSGIELTSGKIKAKLNEIKEGEYFLSGQLKGFIDGHSVLSTKAMDTFKSAHAKSTKVENVAWSDRILPPALVRNLNVSLDEICKNEPADFHPGSGKVVRDIVHPSMYCYVKGISKVNGSPGDPLGKSEGTKESHHGDKDFWGREYEDSIYQWLPAEFFIAEDGKATIKSYINNLDRNKYPGVYGILERMFEGVLPMFESVCSSLRNDFYGVDGVEKGIKSISLRNRTLQVVTKIVEYRVNREENFDGVWHVEGMSHEEVLATALCIVQRDDNFAGAEIEFRRFLLAEEGDDLISSTPQNANRPTDTMGGGDVRPLGSLKTPANRVVVFPNSHIHRLSSMYSSDGADAMRRIVVFWLVNPEHPIVSTANVSQQQGVLSLDDALRNRLALMAERKLHKESYEEREVFLCEH